MSIRIDIERIEKRCSERIAELLKDYDDPQAEDVPESVWAESAVIADEAYKEIGRLQTQDLNRIKMLNSRKVLQMHMGMKKIFMPDSLAERTKKFKKITSWPSNKKKRKK